MEKNLSIDRASHYRQLLQKATRYENIKYSPVIWFVFILVVLFCYSMIASLIEKRWHIEIINPLLISYGIMVIIQTIMIIIRPSFRSDDDEGRLMLISYYQEHPNETNAKVNTLIDTYFDEIRNKIEKNEYYLFGRTYTSRSNIPLMWRILLINNPFTPMLYSIGARIVYICKPRRYTIGVVLK